MAKILGKRAKPIVGRRTIAAQRRKEEQEQVTPVIDGETDDDELVEDDLQSGEFQGFNQYGVKWDDSGVNFRITTEDGINFYGWWRKTRIHGTEDICFCIDIFATREIKGEERDFTVDSITYTDDDPRRNMRSLNNDICAAVNRWFHFHLSDNASRIDALVKRATHPQVRLNRIESIDRLIMKLREFRDTAISCGGTRLFELHSDKPGDPTVHVVVNFTAQSEILESKPPRLGMGVISDHTTDTGGKRDAPRARVEAPKPDAGNIEALKQQLLNCKDDAQKRKIRAIMRKMGHKGGSRNLK